MNTTIWKFALQLAPMQTVLMPTGAKTLCVQMQGDVPMLWAEVDPSAEQLWTPIAIVGTGHAIPGDPYTYIGTVQMNRGTCYVWHIYTGIPGATI